MITTSVSPSTTAHHGLAAHEVVLLLGADPHRGLSSEDAIDRLARFGPNTLPAAKGAGLPMRILRQFHHPLINVLLAADVITAGLGEYVDSPRSSVSWWSTRSWASSKSPRPRPRSKASGRWCEPTPRWWRLTSATMTPIGADINS